jgi:RimJ/RimL family protein N-acetyltransferase
VGLRFHGAKGEPPTPLVRQFTSLDGRDNAAIVATMGTRGRIVGVARYCRIDGASAEVAFVVADEYQGNGVSRRLMHRLRAHALRNGITELVAEVMGGNTAKFHLLSEAGETHSHALSGEVEVTVDLAASH